MRIIVRSFILCYILLLMAGCGTTKKMSSSTTDIQQHSEEQSDITLEERSESSRQEMKDKAEKSSEVTEKETVHTEYDTDKPVNPETGQHPIKSQTTTRETTTKKSESCENSVSDEHEEQTLSFHDNSISSDSYEISETADQSIKRKSNIKWWVVGFAFLLVSGMVLYRKIKRRI